MINALKKAATVGERILGDRTETSRLAWDDLGRGPLSPFLISEQGMITTMMLEGSLEKIWIQH